MKVMEERGPELALVVAKGEAWLMNAKVRDLLEDGDIPPMIQAGDTLIVTGSFLANCRPLALQIIRALRDLQTIDEASILVTEEECWFLERRFRHNDREPEGRALVQKLHELILAFHPELDPPVPETRTEVPEDADRSYEDANKNADEDPGEESEQEPGQGT